MAMLGMQADMQHKSNFSGCYTAWDLNLDANAAVWPTDNVDGILRNRQYYNGTFPPSSDLKIFCNKDLLKQTMLKHEAEFSYQIHELHRLYKRQKELMDEMKKKDIYKHHYRLETLQPNHVLSPKSSNFVQIPHHTSTSINLMHCQPPISEAKGSIFPLYSYDGNRGQAGVDPTHIENSSKASEFMESNCKKVGKKILDLELPADEYFDSEEEGFSEVKMAPEVTDTPANALKKIPEVRDTENKELSISGSGCNSVFPEGSFIPSSISSKKKVMADLNIPVELEEDVIPERRDLSIPLESALEQPNPLCIRDAELEKVEANNSLDLKRMLGFHLCNKPPIANGQCSSHASPSRNHPNSWAKENIKDKEKVRIPDINLEFDYVSDGEKELAKTESVAESEPFEKYPGYGVIDLNSCLSMDEPLLMPSHSIEIDLEPPASPENKECSPPRGESDENQLETPLLSSGQEDGDQQEALVRNAVEAIVSISASEIHTCLESATCEPFKASNSLYWFARVASSVVDDPGSEFGVNIGVKDYGDHEEYLSDGIDYFEAMTLNLTEIKVEESWCKSNDQKEEDSSAIFLTNQPKRGRTRRGKQQRKDFQSEILPSIASLSRYEVTEDLQIIGGLMEAAGAHWECGSSRNAGRNGYTKGRRRSNARSSNVVENTTNMLLKQQAGNSEVGIQQRRLIEWGKITRRRRGPRCPSSNPRLILGQL
ncbi:hypothetical protein REPUB_Repub07fG0052600 [Reevesia pubescens]